LILPFVQNLGRNISNLRPLRRWYEHWCIAVFVVLVAMALWSLLPYGYGLYHALVHENAAGQDAATNDGLKQALLALSAAAIPILTGILQKLAGNKRLIRKLVTVLLVLSGPLFFLVTFFVLTDLFIVPDGDALFDDKAKEAFMGVNGTTALWTAFIIIALYSGLLLNINLSSPHRYYRRQLSRTYLRRSETGSEETKHEDPQRLTDLLQRDDKGLTKAPYHLINCALNIPACDDPNLRGRASDFFVFSKHFCGSPIVSYAPTAEWQDLDEALDLGTAMAISAAAASPQMGANTDSRFSFLLAILNVRLNYWVTAARRPSEPDTVRQPKWLLRWLSPGMWYFLKELTGLGMGENDFYLNLSDGGHVENLAIYELLRRRCKFIIAVDGEADPERTFHGLLTLVRLADIDLGVKINPNLEELRTDDAGNSRSHFLLCPIDYGRGQKGFLLYIKSSMSGNESEFLRKWRMEHPTFPHETTADQLFDESQFEAYRALGEHVAEELFLPEVTGSIQPDTPPLPAQPSARAWFQGLANNLLEPNS